MQWNGKKQPYEALHMMIFYRKKRFLLRKNDDIYAKLVGWAGAHENRFAICRGNPVSTHHRVAVVGRALCARHVFDVGHKWPTYSRLFLIQPAGAERLVIYGGLTPPYGKMVKNNHMKRLLSSFFTARSQGNRMNKISQYCGANVS